MINNYCTQVSDISCHYSNRIIESSLEKFPNDKKTWERFSNDSQKKSQDCFNLIFDSHSEKFTLKDLFNSLGKNQQDIHFLKIIEVTNNL